MSKSSTTPEGPGWLEPLAHRPFPAAVQFAPDVRTAAEILEDCAPPYVELMQTTEAA